MKLQDASAKIGDIFSDVAAKISKYGIEDLKLSPEEMAKAGLKNLEKRYSNPMNFVQEADMETISKHISQSANKVDRDYINLANKFSNSLKQKNLKEAESAAELIREKFENENAFIDLLSDVKNKSKNRVEILNSIDFDPTNKIGQKNIEEKWKQEKGFNKDIPYVNILGESGKNKINKGLYAANSLKGYFNTDDVVKNRIRMGAVGGGYLVGANTLRLASGGNPITNEYGERDIAGIPFV